MAKRDKKHPTEARKPSSNSPLEISIPDGQTRFSPKPSRAVRAIPKSSKGHFVGELTFVRGGLHQTVAFGSYREYQVAVCLLYRSDCVDLEEQLEELAFTLPNGKPSRHYFDYRVTLSSGRRICVSVKEEWEANSAAYQAIFQCIKNAAEGNICDRAITITPRNIHPVEFHNAELFHAARFPEPHVDAIVKSGLKSVAEPVTIEGFLRACGLAGKGFWAMARAIRIGDAKLFYPAKIDRHTLIVGSGVK